MSELLSQTEIEELMTQYGVDRETIVELFLKQYNYLPAEELVGNIPFKLATDYTETGSNAIKEYIWTVLTNVPSVQQIIEQMQPVSEREWTFEFYTRSKNAVLFDVQSRDCFYVHSEFIGQYGKQYWVCVNNINSHLNALPSRKALMNLEVGKFYRCIKHECHKGKGYTYHEYEFEEIAEDEFLASISNLKEWRRNYWG